MPSLFEPKPKCFGKYPFCPKSKEILDPMKKTEIIECSCWRLCRTEYLCRWFDNPSFRSGKILDSMT
jgi:hypothetical protein